MSLNSQLPLSNNDPGKGSLSDILPELQDLVPSENHLNFKDARGRQRSFDQRDIMQGFRQFIQQSSLPALQAQGSQEQTQAAHGPAYPAGSFFGAIPPLNLHGSAAGQHHGNASGFKQDINNSAPADSAAQQATSMPSMPPELMPYANLIQATQAGLFANGTHEIWQGLLQASPNLQQQQQQLLAHMHSIMPQGLPQSSVLTQQPQQPAIAQKLPQHEPVAKPDAIHAAQAPPRGKGIKRGAEGEPKEVPEAIRPAAETSRGDSEPSTSGVSEKPALPVERRWGSEASTGAATSPSGRPARTPRQQEQNKQAQQRYRERRKLKVTEMEGQVGAMQQQLAELQSVIKQNVALQDKTLKLEQQLAEQKRESQRLASQASKAPADGWPPPRSAEALEELKTELQAQVIHLQQCVEQHRLRTADVSGAEMDRATLDELADSASRCMKACQEAQAEGISTIEMLTRDRNAVAAFSAASQEARWAQAIKEVKLEETQRNQLVAWHCGHLKQLEAVFAARQPIIHKIVGFTQHCMDDLGAAQNLERWTNKLQAEGYNNTAQQNLLHLRELRLLRESMQKEAKLAQQYSFVIINRILTPIQAVLLLVNAWPAYCDCLGFTNVLVTQHSAQSQQALSSAGDRNAAGGHTTVSDGGAEQELRKTELPLHGADATAGGRSPAETKPEQPRGIAL